jgi:hypothetical protein
VYLSFIRCKDLSRTGEANEWYEVFKLSSG